MAATPLQLTGQTGAQALNGLRSGSAAGTARPGLAATGGNLDALKAAANKDPKAAIKEAAKQFEALFMQELVKSMRSTTLDSGMFKDGTSDMATGMLDQQYATQLTGLPGGLADAISRQLERQLGLPASAGGSLPAAGGTVHRSATPAEPGAGLRGIDGRGAPRPALPLQSPPQALPLNPQRAALAPASAAGAPSATSAQAPASPTARAQRFLEQHKAAAESASAASGIPAEFMLAQAAHETGWGQREIRNADGSSANNYFGIKAGGDWTGPVATATTTEVIDGVARKVQARFRAYASAAESFADYARLISSSPRYAGVMNAVGSAGEGHAPDARSFAQGLQKAGYATDPAYADKLGRVINTTLRLQRLGS